MEERTLYVSHDYETFDKEKAEKEHREFCYESLLKTEPPAHALRLSSKAKIQYIEERPWRIISKSIITV